MNEIGFPPRPFVNVPNVAATGDGGERYNLPVVQQYLRIALRWKYVIGGAVLACALLGLVVTLLMTPRYTAITTLEISRESNKIVDIQGVERDASVADQEFYQTQYGLLRSRALAERVARQLRLTDDPAFFQMFHVKQDSRYLALVNDRYVPAGRAERERLAGEALLKQVDISPARLSRLVNIGFTSPDPVLSAKVANAWAANFIQATLERRFQATSYARKFLEGRLDQLRQRLEVSERQLVAYASREQIINLPGTGQGQGDQRGNERSIVGDDLAAINASLAQATADRVEAQARFAQSGGGGGESTEALRNDAINALRQRRAELSADYQKLLTQFEPEYPSVKALASQIAQLDRSIAREEGRVSGSLRAGYREASERERALGGRVETLKGKLLDLRRRSIQYNIFQREVDTNRQLYDGLLQRYKEIGVTGGVGVNNVAVVDPADVPDRPSSPRLLYNLFGAIVAGLIIGGAAAFLLEQSDDAIANPQEVERAIGLPLLGSVPVLDGQSPTEALLDRKSQLVDAYLAIQTNLQFSTEHGVPRSIAVTSTRPGEGKSTTSFALSTMLARSNRRTVLVDGDMRSPSVHHLLGIGHDRGLSNYLAGDDDIASLIVPAADYGFMAITAGPLPPNAAELLTGDRLSRLIAELLRQFDHVVIDSPPVMGLADAPLIGSRVEAVVYAIESHSIRASLVRTALGRLASSNARVLGGVLTKFQVRKAHFGYGYDYGYNYGRQDAASV